MSDHPILVTGAAGLIGRHLLARLRHDGRSAIGIDRAPGPDQDDVAAIDLGDIHRLHAVAAERNIGAVVHCGAVSGPMVMIDNPYGIIVANVLGTANIMELARLRRMRRLVFCSSASVYGSTAAPPEGQGVTEAAPLRPSSVYGASKVACEALIAGYRRQHGLDAVALRLSWVYGPGRTTDCIIRTMIEDAQVGRTTRLAWGRGFHRQFIHVEDAVAALVAALDAPVCKAAVYTATGGEMPTIEDVARHVAAAVEGADIALGPGPDPLDDVQHRFDVTAIARDLGFAPRVTLEAGIRSYAAWLAAR